MIQPPPTFMTPKAMSHCLMRATRAKNCIWLRHIISSARYTRAKQTEIEKKITEEEAKATQNREKIDGLNKDLAELDAKNKEFKLPEVKKKVVKNTDEKAKVNELEKTLKEQENEMKQLAKSHKDKKISAEELEE